MDAQPRLIGMTPLDGVVATPAQQEASDRRADLEQLKEGAALLAQHGNRVAALAVLWAAVAIDPVDHAVHRRLAATLASGGAGGRAGCDDNPPPRVPLPPGPLPTPTPPPRC